MPETPYWRDSSLPEEWGADGGDPTADCQFREAVDFTFGPAPLDRNLGSCGSQPLKMALVTKSGWAHDGLVHSFKLCGLHLDLLKKGAFRGGTTVRVS